MKMSRTNVTSHVSPPHIGGLFRWTLVPWRGLGGRLGRSPGRAPKSRETGGGRSEGRARRRLSVFRTLIYESTGVVGANCFGRTWWGAQGDPARASSLPASHLASSPEHKNTEP